MPEMLTQAGMEVPKLQLMPRAACRVLAICWPVALIPGHGSAAHFHAHTFAFKAARWGSAGLSVWMFARRDRLRGTRVHRKCKSHAERGQRGETPDAVGTL